MFGLYTLCTKRSKDGYDDSAEIKIDFLLLIFLKILECIWWPLHLIFLFKSKKWLKYHLLAYQIWKQYWQPPQKFLARNYKLNKKKIAKIAFIETKILELQSPTWSDYKHHQTVEFLPCVFLNSAEALSKFYTRRTCDKAIVYIILPWHSNLMAKV